MKKTRFNASESAIFILILSSVLALPWVIRKTAAFLGTDIASFGDQYGVLNTLFSGLAFFVIYLSLKTQRGELQLQREEMAMARGEHERQNFESQLMFLLKNLGEQLVSVKGEFRKEDGSVCYHEGRGYFAHLFDDFHRLHKGLIWATPDPEFFRMYGIDLDTDEYKNEYKKRHLQDFSFKLVVSVEAKRRKEYFDLIQTFSLILDFLRGQFDYQTKLANGDTSRIAEIERHFDVYAGLIRSTLSVANLTYFLYVQKRYLNGFRKDFITDSLFHKIAEGDYLEWQHYLQMGYGNMADKKEP